MRTLHILNGDSTEGTFSASSLAGDVMIFREIICEGPTSIQLTSPKFWAKRQQFFEKRYRISTEDFSDQTILELNRHTLPNYDEIVLWYEYDLFCQFNMVANIEWLRQHGIHDIYLICVGPTAEEPTYRTLDDFTSDAYPLLYEQRRRLKTEDLDLITEFWEIYNSEHHQALRDLPQSDTFPHLKTVIPYHFKRIPDPETRLSEFERSILSLLNEPMESMQAWLVRWLEVGNTIYKFGDLQIAAMLRDLKPFTLRSDGKISLNDAGRNILDGVGKYDRRYSSLNRLGGLKFT